MTTVVVAGHDNKTNLSPIVCVDEPGFIHFLLVQGRYRREESIIQPPTIITFVCQGLFAGTQLKRKIENVILLKTLLTDLLDGKTMNHRIV